MAFVLDASATLAWLFQEEAARASHSPLAALTDDHALVPSVWPLEVASGLRTGELRGRVTPREVLAFATQLAELPLTIDDTSLSRVFNTTLDLAREYDLSVYDASYLELAMREDLPLATLDASLMRAARQAGVEVIS